MGHWHFYLCMILTVTDHRFGNFHCWKRILRNPNTMILLKNVFGKVNFKKTIQHIGSPQFGTLAIFIWELPRSKFQNIWSAVYSRNFRVTFRVKFRVTFRVKFWVIFREDISSLRTRSVTVKISNRNIFVESTDWETLPSLGRHCAFNIVIYRRSISILEGIILSRKS